MADTVTCAASTCTLIVAPYVAQPEDYAAVSVVFGATLTAACVIWGVKQIYNLLKNRPES